MICLGNYILQLFCTFLRVVQTKAILFAKSMSEGFGSDIERFWNTMTLSSIYSWSIQKFIVPFQSRWMSDPTLSEIDFKNKMTWVWTTLNLLPSEFWIIFESWQFDSRAIKWGVNFYVRSSNLVRWTDYLIDMDDLDWISDSWISLVHFYIYKPVYFIRNLHFLCSLQF